MTFLGNVTGLYLVFFFFLENKNILCLCTKFKILWFVRFSTNLFMEFVDGMGTQLKIPRLSLALHIGTIVDNLNIFG